MFVPLFVCLWLYGWQLYTLHLLISGHDRRTAPKFGSHVRIDKYSHLKKNIDPPHLGDFRGLSIVINLSRRTAPKFGTHVRIDTLTLNIFLPTPPGGVRGLSIVKHLSRQTAPKFGTHVRIDTQNLTHPIAGGFRGLSIVKNLSRRTAPKFCTHVIDTLTLKKIKNKLTHPRGV